MVGGAMIFVQPNSIVRLYILYCGDFPTDIQLPIHWASIAESVDYGEMKRGNGLACIRRILFFPKVRYGVAGLDPVLL
ncbi:hypothetical protein ACLK17_18530 [Escherichia coli]